MKANRKKMSKRAAATALQTLLAQSGAVVTKPHDDPVLIKLARAYFSEREKGSDRYGRADRALEEIRSRVKVNEAIVLRKGKKAVLRDNYEHENRVYRSHGIDRFELQIERA